MERILFRTLLLFLSLLVGYVVSYFVILKGPDYHLPTTSTSWGDSHYQPVPTTPTPFGDRRLPQYNAYFVSADELERIFFPIYCVDALLLRRNLWNPLETTLEF